MSLLTLAAALYVDRNKIVNSSEHWLYLYVNYPQQSRVFFSKPGSHMLNTNQIPD